MNFIPAKRQLEFMDWEFGVFFHFGIRTFYEGHKDWDFEEMALSGFNPEKLDCDSWIKTIKEAGAKYAILVCKHHDGFANWPSEYTEYSVKNTTWKNGGGDVVREYVDACRKYDIKVGLYYSPAEFTTEGRAADEYDDYFINQISELLTGYGKIDYLWFDGCGSENHEYDTERIIKEIRRMQPDILIFNMWDPDTRWVGNEAGVASLDNFNVVENLNISVRTENTEEMGKKRFLPAECDARMRGFNWFYSDSDEETVKSPEELMGLYDLSVGRGANLLLNIGPDRDGLLPEKDCESLLKFAENLKKRFSEPLKYTLDKTDKKYTLTLDGDRLAKCVVLKEDMWDGQKIRDFKISLKPRFQGKDIDVYYGKTVGHKVICTFPVVCTNEITIEINDGKLSNISVF